jgi:hypothetical protein
MNDPKNLPTYTREEVASILTRALDRTHEGGRISHDELLETAREIGMTTLEIEAAVAEETKRRAERILAEEEYQKAMAEYGTRLARARLHLGIWAVTSAVLFAVDMKTAGGVFWYWVALAWAVGVIVHGVRVFRSKPEPAPRITAAPPPPRIEVRGGKMEVVAPKPDGHSDLKPQAGG